MPPQKTIRPAIVRAVIARAAIIVFMAALILVSSLVLASCRRRVPEGGADVSGGDGPGGSTTPTPPPAATGASMPPVAVATTGAGRVIAVGPFTNLRSSGELGPETAWGWGDLADGRQVYFTVAADGSLRALDIPQTAAMAITWPLPDLLGTVGMHYSDFTAWFHPFEGQPIGLGPVQGLSLSPSGRYLLVFRAKEVDAYDTSTWERTAQPSLPALEFPYAGSGVEWVDDTLVTATIWEPGGGPLGLGPDTGLVRLVKEPGGRVASELMSRGDVLAPHPSPDGQWIAVLHIEGNSAVVMPECVFPAEYGREIRVYARESLARGEVQPVAAISAGGGKFLTGPVWSPDSARFSFAETNYVPEPGVDVPASPGNRAVVKVVAVPGFGVQEAALPEGDYAPAQFSPNGGRLVVTGLAASTSGLIWNLAAGTSAPLPTGANALNPYSLTWIGSDLLVGTLWDSGRPILLKAADGSVVDPGWPSTPWFSVSGSRVILKATLDPGESLPPFQGLAAGEWLVIYPVPRP